MKNKTAAFLLLLLLASCNNDNKILTSLSDYNALMEAKGYHLGDKITLPKEIMDNSEAVAISFGDKEINSLIIDPHFFNLGDNEITFIIKKNNGKLLTHDATIKVFSKTPEAKIIYRRTNEYPHDTNNFTEGFYIEGKTVYESVGLEGESKLISYNLGNTNVIKEVKQKDNIFSEGISSIENKIFQLTYRNGIGFIYSKDSFNLLEEFKMPSVINEGWGMTTDGRSLIISDGTNNIYFVNPKKPSEVIRQISIVGNKKIYNQLNELEYYNGYIYSNIWHDHHIIKINPESGEVVGILDLSQIVKENPEGKDGENVLNGIAFKDDKIIVTGKRWSKIYELEII